jgi:hypothetical protein
MRMSRFLQVFALVITASAIVGCDAGGPPMKTGGGGMPQPYSPASGEYIPKK